MDAKEVLEQIAEREGVSVDFVRREMELAIAAAQKNPTAEVQAFWSAFPCVGECPTPEEVMSYFAQMIAEDSV